MSWTTPKLPLPLGGFRLLSNTWFDGPTWVTHPNDISIDSAVFAGRTNVTNKQTDRPRYSGWSSCIFCIACMRCDLITRILATNVSIPNLTVVKLYYRFWLPVIRSLLKSEDDSTVASEKQYIVQQVTIAQATIGANNDNNNNNDSHARYSGLYTLPSRQTPPLNGPHIFICFYTHHYVNVVSGHRLSLT